VEFYLFRDGSFPSFVANLATIPHMERAVIIRSIFNWYAVDAARPGDHSVSRMHRLDELLASAAGGTIRGYVDLIGR